MGKMRRYKYSGTYSRGHEGKLNINAYTEDYADGIAKEKFQGLCPECAKKEFAKRCEEENRKAAEEAKTLNLPELTGTPKQVAWAESIRKDYMEHFQKFIDNFSDRSKFLALRDDFGIKIENEDEIEEKFENCVNEVKEYELQRITDAESYIYMKKLNGFGNISEIANIWKNR